jgi:hypothetical protein
VGRQIYATKMGENMGLDRDTSAKRQIARGVEAFVFDQNIQPGCLQRALD